jgi:hypothetical protein
VGVFALHADPTALPEENRLSRQSDTIRQRERRESLARSAIEKEGTRETTSLFALQPH